MILRVLTVEEAVNEGIDVMRVFRNDPSLYLVIRGDSVVAWNSDKDAALETARVFK